MPSHGVIHFLSEVLLDYPSVKGVHSFLFTQHSITRQYMFQRLSLHAGTTVRMTGRLSCCNSAPSDSDAFEQRASASAVSWELQWEGSKIEVSDRWH